MASGAQALSQGATEQAASVEELTSTINEITNHIGSNAEMAHRANELSKVAVSSVLEGNQHMRPIILPGLIEGSIRSARRGAGLVGQTAESLSNIVGHVEEVAGHLESISNASVQQSEAMQQIALVIDQISSVVQTNAATAEESAAASEELSSQSSLLNGLVNRFRLKEDAGDSPEDYKYS